MAKRTTKVEELIEALCDEKVITTLFTKLQEKIILNINERMDQKFLELQSEINNKIKESIG